LRTQSEINTLADHFAGAGKVIACGLFGAAKERPEEK
jgi:hypothetical protein